jgi:pimeloyl-ACP methyl ester carboxylesterase
MQARCRRSVRLFGSVAVLALLSTGCASTAPNPSFAVTRSDAQRALVEMRAQPKRLERPLVILSGFCDPGIASAHLRGEFRRLTGDDRVIGVSFLFCGDFDDCRREVIAAVDKAFPNDDPRWTTEVDVLGVSMGGLVGRYAAVPTVREPDGRRLRVARLFTISTPHRGASLALVPSFHPLQIDMRAESFFLRRPADVEGDMRKHSPAYQIHPYVRLGDRVVGPANAAPHGQTPRWVPGDALPGAHSMAIMDARIIADVARRLRGEDPLTTDPPQPLPTQTAEKPTRSADRAGRA